MKDGFKIAAWVIGASLFWVLVIIALAALFGCSTPSGPTVEFRPVGYSHMDTNGP